MLFSFYMLLQRQRRAQERYYQISLLLLYVLATAGVILGIFQVKQVFYYLMTLYVTSKSESGPVADVKRIQLRINLE